MGSSVERTLALAHARTHAPTRSARGRRRAARRRRGGGSELASLGGGRRRRRPAVGEACRGRSLPAAGAGEGKCGAAAARSPDLRTRRRRAAIPVAQHWIRWEHELPPSRISRGVGLSSRFGFRFSSISVDEAWVYAFSDFSFYPPNPSYL
ncbi:hypothetical protein DAI22_06g117050 [Oryza sativa Japonica Group]|nr:hypothetical protein DAI22_06g117050 [Oryza sativa Japonica Group]